MVGRGLKNDKLAKKQQVLGLDWSGEHQCVCHNFQGLQSGVTHLSWLGWSLFGIVCNKRKGSFLAVDLHTRRADGLSPQDYLSVPSGSSLPVASGSEPDMRRCHSRSRCRTSRSVSSKGSIPRGPRSLLFCDNANRHTIRQCTPSKVLCIFLFETQHADVEGSQVRLTAEKMNVEFMQVCVIKRRTVPAPLKCFYACAMTRQLGLADWLLSMNLKRYLQSTECYESCPGKGIFPRKSWRVQYLGFLFIIHWSAMVSHFYS